MKRNFLKFILSVLLLTMSLSSMTLPKAYASSVQRSPAQSIVLNTVNEDIPKLVNTVQTSKNTIEITYSDAVDLTKASNPKNYWIQSLDDKIPKDIATLGKDDNVNSKNSLTAEKVIISKKDSGNKTFELKFSQDIPSGKNYNLVICYITAPNGGDFTGSNGSAKFTGK